MIGSGLGPGGGIDDVLLVLFVLCIIWMMNRIKIGKRERSTRNPMMQPYKLHLYFPNL
jgi:hypothetical protein